MFIDAWFIQNKTFLLASVHQENILTVQIVGIKYYPPPKPVDTSEWPEQRKLKIVEKQPNYSHQRAPRMMKMLKLMRGPEEVHTDLLYKGYGVKVSKNFIKL